jgi:hypothetical protein
LVETLSFLHSPEGLFTLYSVAHHGKELLVHEVLAENRSSKEAKLYSSLTKGERTELLSLSSLPLSQDISGICPEGSQQG